MGLALNLLSTAKNSNPAANDTAIITPTIHQGTPDGGAATVRVAGRLVISSRVAVISVVPAATPVAKPAAMVATSSSELAQVTAAVIPVVLPLEYVPSAQNCRVWPTSIEALFVVTPIDSRTMGVGVGVTTGAGAGVGVTTGIGAGVGVTAGVGAGVGIGAGG